MHKMIAKSTSSEPLVFLDMLSLPITDQVFSWEDPDTGETSHFAVSRMAEDPRIQSLEILAVVIAPDFAYYAWKNRGIELPQLARWLAFQGEIPPVLFADMNDGTKNLIDGHHRYVAEWMKGRDTILGRVVPEEIWREYLVNPAQMAAILG